MRRYRLEIGTCLGLAALTLLAYGRVLGRDYEFVNFDDYVYVRDNDQVHAGLTWDSLRWALTSYHAFNWHPLTWVSLQLDHQLYGLDPRGYHLTNLLLHAANSVLLFLALRRMTGAVWRCAFVAALFAVHPQHVESVAWVAERKDVLSTLFWMLTLAAYAGYAARPGVGRYLLVVLTLGLGLMSKPMLVTLPCVLLLLDYWPLARLRGQQAEPGDPSRPRFAPSSAGWLLLEKVPLFALVVGCCVLVLGAQKELIHPEGLFPFRSRVLNGLESYVAYVRQMVWPGDLAVLYPHPRKNIVALHGLGAGLLLLGVTALTVKWRRKRPYLLVGWLWFLGTLVPVIGLIQVGMQARADRYTYIPLIGLFLALTWGVADLLAGRRYGRAVLAAAAAGVLAACTAVTMSQVGYWRNTTTLWDRVLAVNPDDAQLYYTAGIGYRANGQTDLAIAHFRKVVQLRPDLPDGRRLLARSLAEADRLDEAAEHLQILIQREPNGLEAHELLARVRWRQGKMPEAAAQFAEVARLQPGSAQAWRNLGLALHQQGEFGAAAQAFQRARQLHPDAVEYRCDLALTRYAEGDISGATALYREAVGLDPGWPQDFDRIAWDFATQANPRRRDPALAVLRAQQACQATGNAEPRFLHTLAAAYAAAGRFDEAVPTAEKALNLATSGNQLDLAREIEARLRLYRSRVPNASAKHR
jgi:tetratricopeptide (TPR) repeat protein